jgi:hypothetical protein
LDQLPGDLKKPVLPPRAARRPSPCVNPHNQISILDFVVSEEIRRICFVLGRKFQKLSAADGWYPQMLKELKAYFRLMGTRNVRHSDIR